MIKFLVIKDLDASGQISANWLAQMQDSYTKSPEALRKDYAKLVESIARLNVIESTIRREVLHEDVHTEVVKEVSKSWIEDFSSRLQEASKPTLQLAFDLFGAALTSAVRNLARKV